MAFLADWPSQVVNLQMTAAGRQQRRRERRQRGERVGRVVYDLAVIDMLLAHGWLQWAESEIPERVDSALSAALRDLAKRHA